MSLKKWNRLSSNVVFQNRYWSYNLDKFQIGKSFVGEYHYVHTIGSTLIIPITADGKIILVNQYRYLVNRESIEFPCGGVKDDLAIIDNAKIELQEETGFDSNQLIKIGEFAPYNGVSDEICHVFTATDLFHSPKKSDITEEFEILFLTKDQIEEAISSNKIWDGMTLAAWSLAKKNL